MRYPLHGSAALDASLSTLLMYIKEVKGLEGDDYARHVFMISDD